MMADIEEVYQALEQKTGEEVIFGRIGMARTDIAGFSTTTADFARYGRDWWQKRETQIRVLVCNSTTDGLVKEGARDLVAFVFPLLGATFGTAIAIYLTVLVVRRILSGWCGQGGANDCTR
jgi:hypothetical protein